MLEHEARQHLLTMLRSQAQLNDKFRTDWLVKGRTKEYDYEAATAIEITEFMISYRAEFWKKGEIDHPNCVTEIVDAWHFLMSQVILDNGGSVEQAFAEIYEAYQNRYVITHVSKWLAIMKAAKRFMASVLENHDDKIVRFWTLCETYGLSLERLYARYIAKHTLNAFRIENGYREGKYSKVWTLGEKEGEDNYFLSSWIDEQKHEDYRNVTEVTVREFLETAYAARKGQ